MHVQVITYVLTVSVGLLTFAVPDENLRAQSVEWPEFRGPTGQGHADLDGLPVSWSESENITWKVDVEGLGWSSPIVSKGRIYVTTAVAQGEGERVDQSLRLVCLDSVNGRQIWNVEVFKQQHGPGVQMHDKNSHASPTPIIENDRIYVHFGSHGTACVGTDGSVLWRNTELEYMPTHGTGGSPAIVGEHLIICCDGSDKQFAVAINKQSGKMVWRQERETSASRGFSFCTPTAIEVNGTTQVVCPASGAVFAYDPISGEELWRVDYGEGYSVVPRPVFGNGLVYVCSGFGDQTMYAIDPTGHGNVTDTHVTWKLSRNVPKSPSILLVGERIYAVDDRGIASCWNALDGEQIWQERLDGRFSASPLFANGLIYFQDEDGKTTVVEASDEFKLVSINQIGNDEVKTYASYGIVDRAILLRSDSALYRIDNE